MVRRALIRESGMTGTGDLGKLGAVVHVDLRMRGLLVLRIEGTGMNR